MKLSGYKKRNKYLLFILAVLVISALAAIFFYSKPGVKNIRSKKIIKPLIKYQNSSLIIGLPADATNLIGNMAADAPTAEVTSQIYDGLVRYNRNFKIVPDLAKSWKISIGGIRRRRFRIYH